MATALEVVKGALKLLGVNAAETPIEAVEAQDGLESLNDLLNEWEEKGILSGFVDITDVDDEVDVPDAAIGAVKANLAVFIAPEYQKVVTDALERRAKLSYDMLVNRKPKLRPSSYPDTMPVGSGNQGIHDNVNGDVPGTGWDRRFYPDNESSKF